MLTGLLSSQSSHAAHIPCLCGQLATYHDRRSKQLLTVVGPVKVNRAYYLCSNCHQGQCPTDSELDVKGTEFSPGVRRMIATVGSESSFETGRAQLELLANLKVTAKTVERQAEAIGADIAAKEQKHVDAAIQLNLPIVTGDPIPIIYIEMDGTGVPVIRPETKGRKGKNPGEPAHTREVKLGCVFTQTTHDKEGYAIRDLASTTYTGAIETASEFGNRIYLEVWNRGWNRALLKVVIADGAEWIWNLADQHFPGAIQIVDLYHAREHLWKVARCLFPLDRPAQSRWILRHRPKLDEGKIEALVNYLRSFDALSPEAAEILALEATYFEKNAERMRYPKFRNQHLFVGSGVIEAACKTVIGKRLKQSGMFWSLPGANSIIALRCSLLNGRFESYWEDRVASTLFAEAA